MKKFYWVICITITISMLEGCSKKDENYVTPLSDANSFSSKVATDWMQVFRQVVKSESKNPPQASRIYAYAGIGLYEAVEPGMKGYLSLSNEIGLWYMPFRESLGTVDYTAASNEALYNVALQIFGTLKPENSQLIESLHAKYIADLQGKIDEKVYTYSADFGRKVASSVLDRASRDNFSNTRNLTYTVPSPTSNPANWVPTGSVLTPLEPFWGRLKCFAMPNGGACFIPSTIPFSTTPGSNFYNQAMEVLTTSQTLTPDQTAIAKWWADGTGTTSTPPGHWVSIASQVIMQKNLNLAKAAEVYVALNMSMADAFISCWDAKYKINLLRPQTYIRTYFPGNASWTPTIGTPPFPEYPSGHSVSSGAAADILTRLIGTVSFTDTTNVSLGLSPRSFSSFNDAANEAGISRLYGGIHFREAIEKGLLQGKEVSNAFFNNIKMHN